MNPRWLLLVGRLTNLTTRRPNESHIDSIDNDSLSVRSGDVVLCYRWDDILRITAYKQDLITIDCVVFLLDFVGDRVSIVVHEDMAEFNNLDCALALHLKGYDSDWRSSVLLPPFEENSTVIYSLDPSILNSD